MKILLSAFAFSPLWGSEPGVGWNWAVELSHRHQVTVLTHEFFRDHVSNFETQLSRLNIKIEYVPLAPIIGEFREHLLNSQLYYLRWQRAIRPIVRKLLATGDYDLLHHITWGTFRFSSRLYDLGIPFVFGPVGGAERAPLKLYSGLPWSTRLRELVRDFLILSSSVDPSIRHCLSSCDVILCKTPQTLAALPIRNPTHACIAHEIGAPAPPTFIPKTSRLSGALRILYAGRLLGLKGLHLALAAIELAVLQGIDLSFTIVGDGPLDLFLRRKVQRLRLGQYVTFVGSIPRVDLLNLYTSADIFLFPSLHDSSGNVVLESLSRGLPVICLDLGGPAQFVDASCGYVISTRGASARVTSQRLATALIAFAQKSSADRTLLREGALARAQSLSWRAQVFRAYDIIEEKLSALQVRRSKSE